MVRHIRLAWGRVRGGDDWVWCNPEVWDDDFLEDEEDFEDWPDVENEEFDTSFSRSTEDEEINRKRKRESESYEDEGANNEVQAEGGEGNDPNSSTLLTFQTISFPPKTEAANARLPNREGGARTDPFS